jgi:hypothetical protein
MIGALPALVLATLTGARFYRDLPEPVRKSTPGRDGT